VDLAGAAPATKAVIGEVSRVDEPRKLVSYLGQRGAPRYVRGDAGIVLVEIMQAPTVPTSGRPGASSSVIAALMLS
jgi:hypothetical protein